MYSASIARRLGRRRDLERGERDERDAGWRRGRGPARHHGGPPRRGSECRCAGARARARAHVRRGPHHPLRREDVERAHRRGMSREPPARRTRAVPLRRALQGRREGGRHRARALREVAHRGGRGGRAHDGRRLPRDDPHRARRAGGREPQAPRMGGRSAPRLRHVLRRAREIARRRGALGAVLGQRPFAQAVPLPSADAALHAVGGGPHARRVRARLDRGLQLRGHAQRLGGCGARDDVPRGLPPQRRRARQLVAGRARRHLRRGGEEVRYDHPVPRALHAQRHHRARRHVLLVPAR